MAEDLERAFLAPGEVSNSAEATALGRVRARLRLFRPTIGLNVLASASRGRLDTAYACRLGQYLTSSGANERRMDKRLARGETSSQRRLSSVTTAIHLLKSFSADEHEIGISELAKRLGTAKSTVHRLATTLVSEGVLEQ